MIGIDNYYGIANICRSIMKCSEWKSNARKKQHGSDRKPSLGAFDTMAVTENFLTNRLPKFDSFLHLIALKNNFMMVIFMPCSLTHWGILTHILFMALDEHCSGYDLSPTAIKLINTNLSSVWSFGPNFRKTEQKGNLLDAIFENNLTLCTRKYRLIYSDSNWLKALTTTAQSCNEYT